MTAQDAPLDLQPPVAVQIVKPQQAEDSIRIDPAVREKLDAKAKTDLARLLTLEIHAPSYVEQTNALGRIGENEIRESAAASSQLLDRPVRALKSDDTKYGSKVGSDLLALRREMDKLDPRRNDITSAPKKLLGLIPFGSKVVDYLREYQSAKEQIDAIVTSLMHGKDGLLRDNASLDEEMLRIWNLMQRLGELNYYLRTMDDQVSAKIESIDASDPDRAKSLRENVLFAVRQRRQDVQVQAAVNVQGYLAMGLVKKNNQELAAAVERTTTTTLSALRTTLILAQALAGQKDVIDQVNATSKMTESFITTAAGMLESNAQGIADIATRPVVSVEVLRDAYAKTFAAIDAADTYRTQALAAMKDTIDNLQTQLTSANAYLQRAAPNAER